MKHFPEWRMMNWTQGLKKVTWAGSLEILLTPKPCCFESCWKSLGWFYQRSLAEKIPFFRHTTKTKCTQPPFERLMEILTGPPKTPDNFNKSSLPSLFKYLKSWGHKGLDFVYHDLLGCQPLACSQPLRPSPNPRFTAPLSSCCAIVLAGSVGVTRCMACNG